ncbi:MAG: hypothetical protein EXX96DRAFT_608432 [Benjaminiella poitrasii]|nr:MAG: hypothetical protein EXX96DRAFT_608432 [Benjaminiella poitrasii]
MSDIKAHLFPFSVDKEQSINIKHYFTVSKQDEKYETAIMGRKLVGLPVVLNSESTTQGYVWKKSFDDHYSDEADDGEKQENTIWTKTDKTINEFILWKKDTSPNSQDPRINALHDWVEISQAIFVKKLIVPLLYLYYVIYNEGDSEQSFAHKSLHLKQIFDEGVSKAIQILSVLTVYCV